MVKNLDKVYKQIEEDINKEVSQLREESEGVTLLSVEELVKKVGKLDKTYPYLDYHEKYYTSEEDEYYLFNNWIDVEGIDYGWLWVSCEKENKDIRKELSKQILNKVVEISENVKEGRNNLTKVYILNGVDEGIKGKTVYISQTVLEEDEEVIIDGKFEEYIYRKDLVLRYSSKEMW